MNNLESIIEYIIDNVKFESEIESTVIDFLFHKYPINHDEKKIVYEELKSLKIKVRESEEGFKQKINKLFSMITSKNKLEKSDLDVWFEEENINDDIQKKILDYLSNSGYSVITGKDNKLEEENYDLFNELDSGLLDELLDDEEFKAEVDRLEDVINKGKNMEYLTAFHGVNSSLEMKNRALGNILEANKNLVHSIAKKYWFSKTPSFDEDDIFQAGMEGLLKSVEKFDLSRENQFSTYATYWIVQGISRAIDEYSTTIRFPVHVREKIRQLNKVESEFWYKNQEEASNKELGELLNVTEDKIKELKKIRNFANLISLDSPINEEKDSTLSDFIPDYESKLPEEYYFEHELVIELKSIMKEKLKDREARVLSLRFGLDDSHPRTLEEIGQIEGCTRERIRQIESKAIGKLQNKNVINKLRSFFYDK